MRSPLRPLAVAGSLALLLSVAPTQENSAQENFAPKEGEVFPELSFPTLQGKGLTSLKDYRGQKILLIQFASW